MQKNQFIFILSLLFAILVTIFALTNANPVVINLFFYEFLASQALIIFLSASLGAITVALLGLVNHLKLKSEIKTLRIENEELSAKIQSTSDESNASQQIYDKVEV